ncbi:hypothetical protein RJ641_010568 [Dillenia turbinata]|uniref:Uncharacterized protein n=1 Tax=Dillenia turbinata TaxID=194707 RepID=A0AAN8UWJ2_9MAGN
MVWAQQRCSVYAYDCLNGLLLSIILLYLGTEYGQNRVKSLMTTMQIFHVTLDFIDMGYWVVLSACWRKRHFKRGLLLLDTDQLLWLSLPFLPSL